MMLQHRYEQALALAERSVSLHEAHGSGHGLAVALATLGQICVRLGDLVRAEDALHRALDVRSPIQFHETTGAVFDTLAQIHLIRGRYDDGERFSRPRQRSVRRLRPADQPVVRVVGARARRPARAAARRPRRSVDARRRNPAGRRAAVRRAAGHPHRRRSADRREPARRGGAAAGDGRRRARPARSPRPRGANTCGCAARCMRRTRAPADAYHDFSQSAALLDLLGERYQAALSHLALGRLVAETGARSVAERHLNKALAIFQQLGAERDLDDTRARAVAADDDRHRRVRDLARRCRRCDRAPDRRRGGAARTARPRDGVGAARGCRRRLRASSTSSSPAATCAWWRSAGCEPDAARALARSARQRQRLRPRHHRRRTARPRSRRPALRPRRLAAADRTSGRCGGCG